MKQSIPEFGFSKKYCVETFIQLKYMVYIAGYLIDTPTEVMLHGKTTFKNYFKASQVLWEMK